VLVSTSEREARHPSNASRHAACVGAAELLGLSTTRGTRCASRPVFEIRLERKHRLTCGARCCSGWPPCRRALQDDAGAMNALARLSARRDRCRRGRRMTEMESAARTRAGRDVLSERGHAKNPSCDPRSDAGGADRESELGTSRGPNPSTRGLASIREDPALALHRHVRSNVSTGRRAPLALAACSCRRGSRKTSRTARASRGDWAICGTCSRTMPDHLHGASGRRRANDEGRSSRSRDCTNVPSRTASWSPPFVHASKRHRAGRGAAPS